MNKLRKCSCTGKEGFQRMNYLYQISNLLATDSIPGHVAALNYSNLVVNISKKTVQRLDIDIKRTICKRCRCLLIPGQTSRVRIKKKKVLHTCLKCGTIKIYETNKGEYTPWSQRKESLVEMLDYTPLTTGSQATSDKDGLNKRQSDRRSNIVNPKDSKNKAVCENKDKIIENVKDSQVL